MDEEERKKKVQAGKEKLAAFQKKKGRKKRRKLASGNDEEPSRPERVFSGTDSAELSPVSLSDPGSVGTSDLSGDEATSKPGISIEAKKELEHALNENTRLEESLVGKQTAIDALYEENTNLREKISQVTSQSKVSEELSTMSQENEELLKKISQQELALSQQDEVIKQLSTSLQAVTQSRDSLQTDYTSQAEQLTQQIHLLQGQVQQSNATLQEQAEKQGMTAETLLTTKTQIVNLQDSLHEKDATLKLLTSKFTDKVEELMDTRAENEKLRVSETEAKAVMQKLESELQTLKTAAESEEVAAAESWRQVLEESQQEHEMEVQKLRLESESVLDRLLDVVSDLEKRCEDLSDELSQSSVEYVAQITSLQSALDSAQNGNVIKIPSKENCDSIEDSEKIKLGNALSAEDGNFQPKMVEEEVVAMVTIPEEAAIFSPFSFNMVELSPIKEEEIVPIGITHEETALNPNFSKNIFETALESATGLIKTQDTVDTDNTSGVETLNDLIQNLEARIAEKDLVIKSLEDKCRTFEHNSGSARQPDIDISKTNSALSDSNPVLVGIEAVPITENLSKDSRVGECGASEKVDNLTSLFSAPVESRVVNIHEGSSKMPSHGAIENTADVPEANAELSRLNKAIENRCLQLEDEIESLKHENQVLSNRCKDFENTCASLDQSCCELRSTLERNESLLADAENRCLQYEDDLQVLEGRCNELKSQILEFREKYQEAKLSYEDLESKHKETQFQLSEEQEFARNCEMKLKDLESLKRGLETDCSDLNRKCNDLERSRDGLQVFVGDLECKCLESDAKCKELIMKCSEIENAKANLEDRLFRSFSENEHLGNELKRLMSLEESLNVSEERKVHGEVKLKEQEDTSDEVKPFQLKDYFSENKELSTSRDSPGKEIKHLRQDIPSPGELGDSIPTDEVEAMRIRISELTSKLLYKEQELEKLAESLQLMKDDYEGVVKERNVEVCHLKEEVLRMSSIITKEEGGVGQLGHVRRAENEVDGVNSMASVSMVKAEQFEDQEATEIENSDLESSMPCRSGFRNDLPRHRDAGTAMQEPIGTDSFDSEELQSLRVEIATLSAEVSGKVEETQRLSSRLCNMEGRCRGLESEVEQLKLMLEQEMESHQVIVIEKEKRLQNQQQNAVEKDQELEVLRREVSDKDLEMDGLRDEFGEKNLEVHKMRSEVDKRIVELEGLRVEVEDRDHEIGILRLELGKKVGQAEQLITDVADQSQELMDLKISLGSKSCEVNKLKAEIEEKSVEIEHLREEGAKRWDALQLKNSEIEKKDVKIRNLSDEVVIYKGQIERLFEGEKRALDGQKEVEKMCREVGLLRQMLQERDSRILQDGETMEKLQKDIDNERLKLGNKEQEVEGLLVNISAIQQELGEQSSNVVKLKAVLDEREQKILEDASTIENLVQQLDAERVLVSEKTSELAMLSGQLTEKETKIVEDAVSFENLTKALVVEKELTAQKSTELATLRDEEAQCRQQIEKLSDEKSSLEFAVQERESILSENEMTVKKLTNSLELEQKSVVQNSNEVQKLRDELRNMKLKIRNKDLLISGHLQRADILQKEKEQILGFLDQEKLRSQQFSELVNQEQEKGRQSADLLIQEQNENRRHVSEIVSLKKQLGHLTDEISRAQLEVKHYRDQIEQLLSEKDFDKHLSGEVEKLVVEVEAYKEKVVDMRSAIDSLSQEVERVKFERDDMGKKLCQAISEKEDTVKGFNDEILKVRKIVNDQQYEKTKLLEQMGELNKGHHGEISNITEQLSAKDEEMGRMRTALEGWSKAYHTMQRNAQQLYTALQERDQQIILQGSSLQQRENQVQDLWSQLQGYEQQSERLEEERNGLQHQVKDLGDRNSHLGKEVERLNGNIEALYVQLDRFGREASSPRFEMQADMYEERIKDLTTQLNLGNVRLDTSEDQKQKLLEEIKVERSKVKAHQEMVSALLKSTAEQKGQIKKLQGKYLELEMEKDKINSSLQRSVSVEAALRADIGKPVVNFEGTEEDDYVTCLQAEVSSLKLEKDAANASLQASELERDHLRGEVQRLSAMLTKEKQEKIDLDRTPSDGFLTPRTGSFNLVPDVQTDYLQTSLASYSASSYNNEERLIPDVASSEILCHKPSQFETAVQNLVAIIDDPGLKSKASAIQHSADSVEELIIPAEVAPVASEMEHLFNIPTVLTLPDQSAISANSPPSLVLEELIKPSCMDVSATCPLDLNEYPDMEQSGPELTNGTDSSQSLSPDKTQVMIPKGSASSAPTEMSTSLKVDDKHFRSPMTSSIHLGVPKDHEPAVFSKYKMLIENLGSEVEKLRLENHNLEAVLLKERSVRITEMVSSRAKIQLLVTDNDAYQVNMAKLCEISRCLGKEKLEMERHIQGLEFEKQNYVALLNEHGEQEMKKYRNVIKNLGSEMEKLRQDKTHLEEHGQSLVVGDVPLTACSSVQFEVMEKSLETHGLNMTMQVENVPAALSQLKPVVSDEQNDLSKNDVREENEDLQTLIVNLQTDLEKLKHDHKQLSDMSAFEIAHATVAETVNRAEVILFEKEMKSYMDEAEEWKLVADQLKKDNEAMKSKVECFESMDKDDGATQLSKLVDLQNENDTLRAKALTLQSSLDQMEAEFGRQLKMVGNENTNFRNQLMKEQEASNERVSDLVMTGVLPNSELQLVQSDVEAYELKLAKMRGLLDESEAERHRLQLVLNEEIRKKDGLVLRHESHLSLVSTEGKAKIDNLRMLLEGLSSEHEKLKQQASAQEYASQSLVAQLISEAVIAVAKLQVELADVDAFKLNLAKLKDLLNTSEKEKKEVEMSLKEAELEKSHLQVTLNEEIRRQDGMELAYQSRVTLVSGKANEDIGRMRMLLENLSSEHEKLKQENLAHETESQKLIAQLISEAVIAVAKLQLEVADVDALKLNLAMLKDLLRTSQEENNQLKISLTEAEKEINRLQVVLNDEIRKEDGMELAYRSRESLLSAKVNSEVTKYKMLVENLSSECEKLKHLMKSQEESGQNAVAGMMSEAVIAVSKLQVELADIDAYKLNLAKLKELLSCAEKERNSLAGSLEEERLKFQNFKIENESKAALVNKERDAEVAKLKMLVENLSSECEKLKHQTKSQEESGQRVVANMMSEAVVAVSKLQLEIADVDAFKLNLAKLKELLSSAEQERNSLEESLEEERQNFEDLQLENQANTAQVSKERDAEVAKLKMLVENLSSECEKLKHQTRSQEELGQRAVAEMASEAVVAVSKLQLELADVDAYKLNLAKLKDLLFGAEKERKVLEQSLEEEREKLGSLKLQNDAKANLVSKENETEVAKLRMLVENLSSECEKFKHQTKSQEESGQKVVAEMVSEAVVAVSKLQLELADVEAYKLNLAKLKDLLSGAEEENKALGLSLEEEREKLKSLKFQNDANAAQVSKENETEITKLRMLVENLSSECEKLKGSLLSQEAKAQFHIADILAEGIITASVLQLVSVDLDAYKLNMAKMKELLEKAIKDGDKRCFEKDNIIFALRKELAEHVSPSHKLSTSLLEEIDEKGADVERLITDLDIKEEKIENLNSEDKKLASYLDTDMTGRYKFESINHQLEISQSQFDVEKKQVQQSQPDVSQDQVNITFSPVPEDIAAVVSTQAEAEVVRTRLAESQAKVQTLQEENLLLQQDVADLHKETEKLLQTIRDDTDSVVSELRASEGHCRALENELTSAKDENHALNVELRALKHVHEVAQSSSEGTPSKDVRAQEENLRLRRTGQGNVTNNKLSEFQSRFSSLESDYQQLQKDSEMKDDKIAELEIRLEDFAQQIRELYKQVSAYVTETNTLNLQLDDLKFEKDLTEKAWKDEVNKQHQDHQQAEKRMQEDLMHQKKDYDSVKQELEALKQQLSEVTAEKELLGLELMEACTARDNYASTCNTLGKHAADFVDDSESLQVEMASLKGILDKTKEQNVGFKTSLEDSNKEVERLTDLLEMSRQEVEELKVVLSNSKTDQLELEVENLRHLLENSSDQNLEVNSLKAKNEELLSKVEILADLNEQLDTNCNEYLQTSQEVKDRNESLEVVVQQLKNEVTQLERASKLAEAEKISYTESLEKQLTSKDKDITCLQGQINVLTDVAHEKADLEKEVSGLLEEVTKLIDSKNELEVQLEEGEHQLKEFENLQQENLNHKQKIEGLMEEFGALKSDNEYLDTKCETLRQDSEGFLLEKQMLENDLDCLMAKNDSLSRDLVSSKAENESLVDNCELLKAENERLEVIAASAEDLRKKTESMTDEISAKHEEINDLLETSENLKQMLLSLEEERDKLLLDLAEESAEKEDLSLTCNALGKQVESSAGEIERLEVEMANLKGVLNSSQDKSFEKVEQLSNENSELLAKNSELEVKIADVVEQKCQLEKNCDEYLQSCHLVQEESMTEKLEIERLNQLVEELQEEISALSAVKDENESIRTDYSLLKADLDAKEKDLSDLQEKLRALHVDKQTEVELNAEILALHHVIEELQTTQATLESVAADDQPGQKVAAELLFDKEDEDVDRSHMIEEKQKLVSQVEELLLICDKYKEKEEASDVARTTLMDELEDLRTSVGKLSEEKNLLTEKVDEVLQRAEVPPENPSAKSACTNETQPSEMDLGVLLEKNESLEKLIQELEQKVKLSEVGSLSNNELQIRFEEQGEKLNGVEKENKELEEIAHGLKQVCAGFKEENLGLRQSLEESGAQISRLEATVRDFEREFDHAQEVFASEMKEKMNTELQSMQSGYDQALENVRQTLESDRADLMKKQDEIIARITMENEMELAKLQTLCDSYKEEKTSLEAKVRDLNEQRGKIIDDLITSREELNALKEEFEKDLHEAADKFEQAQLANQVLQDNFADMGCLIKDIKAEKADLEAQLQRSELEVADLRAALESSKPGDAYILKSELDRSITDQKSIVCGYDAALQNMKEHHEEEMAKLRAALDDAVNFSVNLVDVSMDQGDAVTKENLTKRSNETPYAAPVSNAERSMDHLDIIEPEVTAELSHSISSEAPVACFTPEENGKTPTSNAGVYLPSLSVEDIIIPSFEVRTSIEPDFSEISDEAVVSTEVPAPETAIVPEFLVNEEVEDPEEPGAVQPLDVFDPAASNVLKPVAGVISESLEILSEKESEPIVDDEDSWPSEHEDLKTASPESAESKDQILMLADILEKEKRIEELQEHLATVKVDLREMQKECDHLLEERDSMQSKCEQEIKNLQNEHDTEIQRLKDLVCEYDEAKEKQLEALKAKHLEEIEELRIELLQEDEELDVMKRRTLEDLLSQERELRNQTAEELDEEIQFLRSENERLQAEIQAAQKKIDYLEKKIGPVRLNEFEEELKLLCGTVLQQIKEQTVEDVEAELQWPVDAQFPEENEAERVFALNVPEQVGMSKGPDAAARRPILDEEHLLAEGVSNAEGHFLEEPLDETLSDSGLHKLESDPDVLSLSIVEKPALMHNQESSRGVPDFSEEAVPQFQSQIEYRADDRSEADKFQQKIQELEERHELEMKRLTEHLKDMSEIEKMRLRAEIELELRDEKRQYKTDLDLEMKKQLKLMKQEQEMKFIEELQKSRSEMLRKQEDKIEAIRRKFSGQELHQVSTVESTEELEEVVQKLQQENQDHHETRHVLLEQLDNLHFMKEAQHEQILSLNANKDHLEQKVLELQNQLEKYTGQSSIEAEAETDKGEWRVKYDLLLSDQEELRINVLPQECVIPKSSLPADQVVSPVFEEPSKVSPSSNQNQLDGENVVDAVRPLVTKRLKLDNDIINEGISASDSLKSPLPPNSEGSFCLEEDLVVQVTAPSSFIADRDESCQVLPQEDPQVLSTSEKMGSLGDLFGERSEHVDVVEQISLQVNDPSTSVLDGEYISENFDSFPVGGLREGQYLSELAPGKDFGSVSEYKEDDYISESPTDVVEMREVLFKYARENETLRTEMEAIAQSRGGPNIDELKSLAQSLDEENRALRAEIQSLVSGNQLPKIGSFDSQSEYGTEDFDQSPFESAVSKLSDIPDLESSLPGQENTNDVPQPKLMENPSLHYENLEMKYLEVCAELERLKTLVGDLEPEEANEGLADMRSFDVSTEAAGFTGFVPDTEIDEVEPRSTNEDLIGDESAVEAGFLPADDAEGVISDDSIQSAGFMSDEFENKITEYVAERLNLDDESSFDKETGQSVEDKAFEELLNKKLELDKVVAKQNIELLESHGLKQKCVMLEKTNDELTDKIVVKEKEFHARVTCLEEEVLRLKDLLEDLEERSTELKNHARTMTEELAIVCEQKMNLQRELEGWQTIHEPANPDHIFWPIAGEALAIDEMEFGPSQDSSGLEMSSLDASELPSVSQEQERSYPETIPEQGEHEIEQVGESELSQPSPGLPLESMTGDESQAQMIIGESHRSPVVYSAPTERILHLEGSQMSDIGAPVVGSTPMKGEIYNQASHDEKQLQESLVSHVESQTEWSNPKMDSTSEQRPIIKKEDVQSQTEWSTSEMESTPKNSLVYKNIAALKNTENISVQVPEDFEESVIESLEVSDLFLTPDPSSLMDGTFATAVDTPRSVDSLAGKLSLGGHSDSTGELLAASCFPTTEKSLSDTELSASLQKLSEECDAYKSKRTELEERLSRSSSPVHDLLSDTSVADLKRLEDEVAFLRDERVELRSLNDGLRRVTEQLKKKNHDLVTRNDELDLKNMNLEVECEALRARISELEKELDHFFRKNDKLQNKNKDLVSKCRRLETLLADRLNDMKNPKAAAGNGVRSGLISPTKNVDSDKNGAVSSRRSAPASPKRERFSSLKDVSSSDIDIGQGDRPHSSSLPVVPRLPLNEDNRLKQTERWVSEHSLDSPSADREFNLFETSHEKAQSPPPKSKRMDDSTDLAPPPTKEDTSMPAKKVGSPDTAQSHLDAAQDKYQRDMSRVEDNLKQLEEKLTVGHQGTTSVGKKTPVESSRFYNELSQLRKVLQETKDAYSQENSLLKAALEHERLSYISDRSTDVYLSAPKSSLGSETPKVLSPRNDIGSMPEYRYPADYFALREKLQKLERTNHDLIGQLDNQSHRLRDQEKMVNDLKNHLDTSDIVTSEVQHVFTHQLAMLQNQRDYLESKVKELRGRDEEIATILGDKLILEENLRREKELLRHVMHEKDIQNLELIRAKTKSEEKDRDHKRLQNILREKDRLEADLVHQKHVLQDELSSIEGSLIKRSGRNRQERDQTLHDWSASKEPYQCTSTPARAPRSDTSASRSISEAAVHSAAEDLDYQHSIMSVDSTRSDRETLRRLQRLRMDSELQNDRAIGRLKSRYDSVRLNKEHSADVVKWRNSRRPNNIYSSF